MNQHVEKSVYNPPDHEKMNRALRDANMVKPTKAIILLAYHAGLTVGEMVELKGTDIEGDFSFIKALDGRRIPITPQLAEALKELYWLDEEPGRPIIYTKSWDKAMSTMHAGRLAKSFLCFAEMPKVRLGDLRTACIIDWMQRYPWEYVAQISGVIMGGLTQRYQYYLSPDAIRKKAGTVNPLEITPTIVHAILQKHTNDIVGLILRLTINHRLSHADLVRLTWDMVDWDGNVIRFNEKTIPITEEILPCLKVARDKSKTNWVFVYPNTQTPYTGDTSSYCVNKALIQDGYIGLTSSQLIRATAYLEHRKIVYDIIREKGYLKAKDLYAATNIGWSRKVELLNHMKRTGEIIQIGHKYYSSKTTVSPDKFIDIVKKLDKESGGQFTTLAFAKETGLDPSSATAQIRKLIASGEVQEVNRETYAYVGNRKE